MRQGASLKWNLGGWLGSQLGGSAWILLAGLLSLPKHLPVALILIALFSSINLVGWLLWRRRETLSAYAGIQILLLVLGLGGLESVYLLHRARVYEAIQHGGAISAPGTYLLLLVMVPLLMIVCHIRFGRKPNRLQDGTGEDKPTEVR